MNDIYKINISPDFKIAQELFSKYFILKSNKELRNNLINLNIDVSEFDSKSLRMLYNNIILKYYPNETSIKSSFINNVLFKSDNHVSIFELPVGNSRVDLCKINGYSYAFEIKTDLDNLTRLNKQLNDYLQIFEYVYIICSVNKLSLIEDNLTPSCGIYTYKISSRGNYSFSHYKKATISNEIDSYKQLNILNKQELNKFFNIKDLFNKQDKINFITNNYTNADINKLFKETISLRYKNNWDFLKNNEANIFEIDYQWFFKNIVDPNIIYV